MCVCVCVCIIPLTQLKQNKLDVCHSPNNKGYLGFIKENMTINKDLQKQSFH